MTPSNSSYVPKPRDEVLKNELPPNTASCGSDVVLKNITDSCSFEDQVFTCFN